MILRTLRLKRFGRFAEGAWEFAPGLTVIRGPNEAGKSTMREAIVRLLLPGRKMDTRAADFLALTRWGSDQRFLLGCEFEVAERRYDLLRDFEAGRVELNCATTGELLTDEPAINERLWEILQIASREIYETTACLAQKEFVRLQAGKEVAELLQQTVAGSASGGGAQRVLADLKGQIAALNRGIGRPVKNPGPICATVSRIAGLREEIALLRPVVERACEAADRIARAVERAAEVERGLGEAVRIRERAQERRKVEEELETVSREFHSLDRRSREARDLLERIRVAEEKLAALPDLSATRVEEVAKLIDEAERAERRAPEVAEAAKQAAEQAEQDLERVRAAEDQVPDERVVEQARGLQRDVQEMREDAERAEMLADEAGDDLAAARAASGTQRSWFIAAGVLILAGAGLALGLANAWLWLIAAAGLAVGVMGAVRGPRIAVPEAEKRRDEAAAELRDQRAKLTAAQEQLARLLERTGAADADALAGLQRASRQEVEDVRARQAAAAAVASRAVEEAERAQQQVEITAARLQHHLDQLGAKTAAGFLQTAREVADLRADCEKHRRELKGVLGGQELAEIDERLSQLGAHRMGLQQRLESEELAWAELDAERFEALKTQIAALETEREQLRTEIDACRGAADHPDADPERLRRLEEQLVSEQERLERLQERQAALELTYELLGQAHEETLAQAADVLEPRTSELLAAITGGRYCDVEFDRVTLAPLVHSAEKGSTVDPDEELSCATREQVYLAARLALTRLLWPEQCPPIMLDDPFVNFDAARRNGALQVIQRMAESHQVLLFTCHDLYDEAADLVIELPAPIGGD